MPTSTNILLAIAVLMLAAVVVTNQQKSSFCPCR